MNFQESVKTCFQKYADFSGRAKRSEYWWFALFYIVVYIVLSMVHEMVGLVFSLGLLVPSIAAAARRLHDTNRSGWWQLLVLVPIIGSIVLIVFLAQDSKPEEA